MLAGSVTSLQTVLKRYVTDHLIHPCMCGYHSLGRHGAFFLQGSQKVHRIFRIEHDLLAGIGGRKVLPQLIRLSRDQDRQI
jgi:hypothetical protein